MIDFLYQFLASLGYTHPVHPPMTHMPIGLTTGAFVFALGAYVMRKRQLRITAHHAFILAFIFIFPTILLGVFDWVHFYNAALIFPIKMKIILAGAVFLLLSAGIILGTEKREKPLLTTVIYGLAFLCFVGLGYFGGNIVFGGRVAEAPSSSGGGAVSLQSTVPAQYQAGASIFENNCASCHPRGGNIIEPTLELKNAPQLASFKEFADFVHQPHMPNGDPGAMPAFPTSKLSDELLQELYDYIVYIRDQPSWQ